MRGCNTRRICRRITLEEAQNSFQDHLSVTNNNFRPREPQKQGELSKEYLRAQELHHEQFSQVTSQIESSRENAQQHFDSESERFNLCKAV